MVSISSPKGNMRIYSKIVRIGNKQQIIAKTQCLYPLVEMSHMIENRTKNTNMYRYDLIKEVAIVLDSGILEESTPNTKQMTDSNAI